MEYSESPHCPLHIYADQTWYFITASTINSAQYLKTTEHLKIWQDELLKITAALNIDMAAWVILRNHHHILLELHQGRDLAKLTKYLHGRTSHQFNQLDNTRGRQVWYSYWDICIRGEQDFWTRFNYIHYNPVKHGYVKNPEDWEFSSYRFYLRKEGEDWLAKCWLGYPADDLMQDDKY